MKQDPEELFWLIVQTAPFVEARALLRSRRIAALEERLEAIRKKDGIKEAEANLLLTKFNDEMDRINRLDHNVQVRDAVKALFGEDSWERVRVWMAAATEGRA
jgi:hypothetical protein